MRGCKRRSNQIARHRRRATSLKDVRYAPSIHEENISSNSIQILSSADQKIKVNSDQL